MPDNLDSVKHMEDRGWSQMKGILDRELPEKKEDRGLWLWLTGAIVIGLILLSWIYWPSTSITKNESRQPIAEGEISTDNLTDIGDTQSGVIKKIEPITNKLNFNSSKNDKEDEVVEGQTSSNDNASLVILNNRDVKIASITKEDHLEDKSTKMVIRDSNDIGRKLRPEFISYDEWLSIIRLPEKNQMRQMNMDNLSLDNSQSDINLLPKIKLKLVQFARKKDHKELINNQLITPTVTYGQNNTRRQVGASVFALAQSSTDPWNVGWASGLRINFRIHKKVDLLGTVGYNVLYRSRKLFAADILSLRPDVFSALSGQFVNDSQSYTGRYTYTNIGVGLSTKLHITSKWSLELGATRRFSSKDNYVSRVDVSVLANNDAQLLEDIDLSSITYDQKIDHSWAYHVQLCHKINRNWGVFSGLEVIKSNDSESSSANIIVSGSTLLSEADDLPLIRLGLVYTL